MIKPTNLALGQGLSLSPTIRHPSLIEYENSGKGPYRVGELVIYSSLREQVCHRIILKTLNRELRWYLLKGDGNLEADGWIPEYRIHGRVLSINGQKPFRKISLLLFAWISIAIQFIFFESPAGKMLSRLRKHYAPQPILAPLLRKLFHSQKGYS